jgi:hypothetical protein
MDDEMADAWREAGTRLGIRVLSPDDLQLANGDTVAVEAFLPDFGGTAGAAAVSLEDEARWRRAGGSTAFVSQLGEPTGATTRVSFARPSTIGMVRSGVRAPDLVHRQFLDLSLPLAPAAERR